MQYVGALERDENLPLDAASQFVRGLVKLGTLSTNHLLSVHKGLILGFFVS